MYFFFGILLEEVCFLKGAQSAVHLEVTALLRTGQKKIIFVFFFELFHKEIVFRYSLTITYGFFLLIESNFTDVIIVWFFFQQFFMMRCTVSFILLFAHQLLCIFASFDSFQGRAIRGLLFQVGRELRSNGRAEHFWGGVANDINERLMQTHKDVLFFHSHQDCFHQKWRTTSLF